MYYTPYICHYGVKGMKWGIRRSIKRVSTNAKRIGKNTVNYVKKNKKQIAKVAIKSALTLAGFGAAATIVNDILSMPSADAPVSQTNVTQQARKAVDDTVKNLGSKSFNDTMKDIGTEVSKYSGASPEYLQELAYNSKKNSF